MSHSHHQRGTVLATVVGLTLGIVWSLTTPTPGLCAEHVGTDKPAVSAPGGLMNLDMEQLTGVRLGNVYGASRYKQKSSRAPATVTVLTADDIRKYGWRTMADVLRSVRGFYVSYDRNYSYVGVRGFGRPSDYNSRLLVLIDNHRINDWVFGSALVGPEFMIDIDLIDRVEIVRGPSSALYGTGAFFGIVNVITRDGATMKASELSGEIRSQKGHRGRITLGHEFADDLGLLVSTSHYKSDGDRRLIYPEYAGPLDNDGLAEDVDGEKADNQFAKIRYKDLTIEYAKVKRAKVIPTGSYGTLFNSPDSRTDDSQDYLDLRYEHTSADDLTTMGRLFTNRYDYRGAYQYDTVGNRDSTDNVLLRDGAIAEWNGAELQFAKRFSPRFQTIVGGEYQHNARQDQFTFDELPFQQRLDDQRRSNFWAFYFESEWEVFKGVTVNAGVRHDHFSTFGDTTNPRVGLILQPRDSTRVKLLYGTAFRAPNNYELFYGDGGNSQKANTALTPETIATYEAVVEEKLNDRLQLSTAYYYYQMKSLVDQITDPVDGLLVFQNSNTIHAHGLEVELSGRWPSGVELRSSLAIQSNRNEVTGLLLTNSPRQMFKVNASFPLWAKKVWLGVEGQHLSRRLTQASRFADAYTQTNLTLTAPKVSPGLELSATLYNALDETIGDPGGSEHLQDVIGQDGRTFRLKATRKF